jgi:hypothetical protein
MPGERDIRAVIEHRRTRARFAQTTGPEPVRPHRALAGAERVDPHPAAAFEAVLLSQLRAISMVGAELKSSCREPEGLEPARGARDFGGRAPSSLRDRGREVLGMIR